MFKNENYFFPYLERFEYGLSLHQAQHPILDVFVVCSLKERIIYKHLRN